jgi:cysteine desulfurase/selenocysteine lyase
VPVLEDGQLDLDALDELLARAPKLVAVAHVSNVLGTINPIAAIARRAHAAGAVVMVDGTQAVPQLPVDLRELDVDFYAWTGHKAYGPTGIGVLHGRRELLEEMPPFIGGGHMIRTVSAAESTWAELPGKFEAGTSQIAEVVGLGAAVDWLSEIGMANVRSHEESLVADALERLSSEVPGLILHGPLAAADRGAVVSFVLDGAHPHDVGEILGSRGVCVRAGHHCAQPLMRRLGVPATSRASFAVHNTLADIDRLIDGLGVVRSTLRLN